MCGSQRGGSVVTKVLDHSRGNADTNAVRWDIPRYNGSSAYYYVIANCHTREYNAAVPKVDVISHGDWSHDVDLGILISEDPNTSVVGFEVGLRCAYVTSDAN